MTYDLAGVPIAFDIGGEADFRAGRPVLVPPTCSVCGSADDVERCQCCQAKLCSDHIYRCERCGQTRCIRHAEAEGWVIGTAIVDCGCGDPEDLNT